VSRWSAATWRPAWSFAGLLVAYFAFPVEWNASVAAVAVGLALTTVGLAVLGRTMALEVQRLRAGIKGRATGVLTMMLVLLIMSFSLVFYLLEQLSPGQFAGLSTRTDALYFTLSTMTTVGYGDVHAEGQVARALVCGLIVFNIVVVASLVRAHTRLGPPSE
jgi:hypothetical protein